MDILRTHFDYGASSTEIIGGAMKITTTFTYALLCALLCMSYLSSALESRSSEELSSKQYLKISNHTAKLLREHNRNRNVHHLVDKFEFNKHCSHLGMQNQAQCKKTYLTLLNGNKNLLNRLNLPNCNRVQKQNFIFSVLFQTPLAVNKIGLEPETGKRSHNRLKSMAIARYFDTYSKLYVNENEKKAAFEYTKVVWQYVSVDNKYTQSEFELCLAIAGQLPQQNKSAVFMTLYHPKESNLGYAETMRQRLDQELKDFVEKQNTENNCLAKFKIFEQSRAFHIPLNKIDECFNQFLQAKYGEGYANVKDYFRPARYFNTAQSQLPALLQGYIRDLIVPILNVYLIKEKKVTLKFLATTDSRQISATTKNPILTENIPQLKLPGDYSTVNSNGDCAYKHLNALQLSKNDKLSVPRVSKITNNCELSYARAIAAARFFAENLSELSNTTIEFMGVGVAMNASDESSWQSSRKIEIIVSVEDI